MKSIKKIKQFLSAILIFSFVVFNSNAIYAAETIRDLAAYKTLETQYDVPLQKAWTVKVTYPLDGTSVNSTNIELVSKSTKEAIPLAFEYSTNDKFFKVTPDYTKIKYEETYTLYIHDLKTNKGTSLNTPAKMDFVVENAPGAVQNAFNAIEQATYELTYDIRFKYSSLSTVNNDYRVAINLGKIDGTFQKYISSRSTDFKLNEDDTSITSLASGTVSGGVQKSFKVSKTYTLNNIKSKVDLSKTKGDYSRITSDISYYLKPTYHVESNEKEIINLANSLFKGITNPYLKAKKAFEYVVLNMKYDLNSPNANQGALSAIRTKVGVCEDYAALMTALLRAGDVPARVNTGFCFYDNELIAASNNGNYFRHAWVEFYLPEYGWIPADPTHEYTRDGIRYVNYEFFTRFPQGRRYLKIQESIEQYDDDSMVLETFSKYSAQFNIDARIVKK
ncbi:transglutaminase-like putative cysteine protease [Clostridium pascui]|uniref:transglutaminase-like domain-containing protein n=1 Tax=Clostridium pascui TaxID=46609 RepID=UPI00195C0CAB|nr:transglutaminase domain-containing protein [Clostridium pascui]MBM7869823.1 transglutaminase-like putative cysteine protease [Clostridium pascui]